MKTIIINMKTMKMMMYGIMLALGVMACSQSQKEQTQNAEQAIVEVANVQEEPSNPAVLAYMELKNALVQTNATLAAKAGSTLSDALKSEGMNEALVQAADAVASTEDVEEQRAQFKVITDGLTEAFKNNDEQEGVYVQYCPMAFDNTGASWLSLSEEIRNPYFGDKMLKCGRVAEQL